MTQIVKIIIICVVIKVNDALFGSSLKKLKEKTKNAYKKQFGRDKTWHFLGYDLTEYPGTNEKYRQINKEKWDDYYKCLNEQNSKIGRDFSITPEAVQGFEGTTIRLDCKLCLSPQESEKLNSIEWFWASRDNKKLHPIDYTEHILISPTDRALQIFHLEQKHSGQYVCRIAKAEATPYFLTINPANDEDLNEVRPNEAPTGPYPTQPLIIDGTNLIIDTEWMPWTSCNKCNQIGRRHRLGYCIIRMKDEDEEKYNTNNNTDENYQLQIQKIRPEHLQLIAIFKFGIPCDSHILPSSIKKLDIVKRRKNEIMSGFCKTDCPEDKVFEVRDKNGNVIERANNSAGIYSTLQGAPSVQPSVERTLVYAEKGKKIVLACPGNLNSDIPVQWQIGSKLLIPELLVIESHGRIYISITDKIHIKKAKISDTNIYSCWQHSDIAGTVRLIVEKRISLDFNHHIMLLGMILILSVFLLVFIRIFSRRKIVKNI